MKHKASEHTPAECTMHFGLPEVPELYRIKAGWLKGNCVKVKGRSSAFSKNLDNSTLELNHGVHRIGTENDIRNRAIRIDSLHTGNATRQ